MSTGMDGVPPSVRRLLRAALPTEQAERALGDLDELVRRTTAARGPAAARRACMREAVSIVVWAAIDRVRRLHEPTQPLRPAGEPVMTSDSIRDFRYAARTLRRSPGFTVVALLTLALGIGANTAIFSVVDRVLLHPVPWPDADRIEVIGWDWTGEGNDTWALSSAKAQFWKDAQRSFEAFAITGTTQFVLTGAGEPVQVAAELVSEGYFDVVGIAPALGRAFTPDEDRPGGAPVVILTDGVWQRAFGGDPDVVGRTLTLDGSVHTVVGVMPPGFRGADEEGADLFAPLQLVANPAEQGHNNFAFGRLAPGVTRAALAAEVTSLRARLDEAYPGIATEREAFRHVGYVEFVVGDFLRTVVWLVFGAVATVLLIACANVTSLVLGRAESRRRELAVRAALGASRTRIVVQLLAESLLLTLAGGVLGLAFARAALNAILALAPADIPGLDSVGLSLPVLGFALLVSVVTGIGVGLAGALPVIRSDLNTLREGGRAETGSRRRVHVRGLLVFGEVAFSVVLLVGAGLLIASFLRLRGVELGFETDGVYTVELRLPAERYATTDATWQFESQVLERVRTLPGVTAAGSAANLPLVRGLNIGATVLSPGDRREGVIEFRAVSPEFLDILGARVVAGRGLEADDGPDDAPVALVSQAFVRRFLAEHEPLGALISVDGPDRTVVGVVEDLRDIDVKMPARPTIFVPRSQAADEATRMMNEWFLAALAIRAEDGEALAPALREAVREADPEQPIVRMRSMDEVVGASIARDRFLVRLFVAFGGFALVLTAIGVYGVVSYSVGTRTREVGLRMALGASREGVVGLVVRQGMGMILAGVALGLLVASAAARLLSGIVFEVSTADPATFVAVAAVIVSVALLACWLPARRASRVHPMVALRGD